MTQTLTTKVLNDFITGQGYGVAPSAVEAMARELLANREAQPVAWDYEWASCITCDGPQNFKHVIEREAPPRWAIDEGQARNVTPLYTVLPVQDELVDQVCHAAAGIYRQSDDDKAQAIIDSIRVMLAAPKGGK